MSHSFGRAEFSISEEDRPDARFFKTGFPCLDCRYRIFAGKHRHCFITWLDSPCERAYDQIKRTLETLRDRVEHQNGFFYHFLDLKTGHRVWRSEASSIDTALLLAGALLAAQYFPNTKIPHLTKQMYERINWKWMTNGSDLICMRWKPESGFLPYYWDSYNELIILQTLAIGAPKNPGPAEAWDAWNRFEGEFN